jgi:hypothetical protein
MKPGVGPLDHPAPSAQAGLVLERLGLLAARADVGSEAELGREPVHLGVVVAAVEAQPLRPLRRRAGPRDRDRLDGGAAELEVVQICAGRFDAERDALTLGEEAPFRPFLPLSVGLGPVLSPPRGALPSAPSIASHSHSIPTRSS